jgi:hypothetical protein
MTYHLTPITKHRHSKLTYDGLHLGTSRISLSRRFAERFDGVRRVRLSYDTAQRTICLRPVKPDTGPAGPDVYRISRNADGAAFIYCATLRAVMPTGRYRFIKQRRDGYICQQDTVKP